MQEDFNNRECQSVNNENLDINQQLISDRDEILNEELQADANTAIPEPVVIAEEDANKSKLPDAQWFDEYGKKLLAASSPIIQEYHKSEIDNVNKIINSILAITKSVSFTTIALVALFIVFNKDAGAIISAITGGVIDAILGVLTGLFNSTLKSQKSYFDSESDSAKFNQMLLLVQTISAQDKKDSVIVEILHKHFDIPENKQ